jgi:hypothetical protein
MSDVPDQRGEPDPVTGMREHLFIAQLEECWADIRNYDAILWQIPAAISAIGGLMANALVQPDITFGPWSRPIIAFAAAGLTLPLLVALVKNRIFQTDRNNWRIALYTRLMEGGPELPKARDVYPEGSDAPDGLVLLSSRAITGRFEHGPVYWKFLARVIRPVSAFNVLLLVSLAVFVGELGLGTWFTLNTLRPDWAPLP